MADYYTIFNNIKTQIEIKKSIFICAIYSISDEEDVKRILDSTKKEHYKANHNCYAYILGEDSMNKKCSDDGEPSLTAGRPILSVLEQKGVTNVLCVVTRYFGGVKLGTGGLVRAYTDATKEGLEQCQIATMSLGKCVKIHTDYATINKVLYELSQRNLKQEDSEYTDVITITVVMPIEDVDGFEEKITQISAGKSTIEVVQEVYFEKMV